MTKARNYAFAVVKEVAKFVKGGRSILWRLNLEAIRGHECKPLNLQCRIVSALIRQRRAKRLDGLTSVASLSCSAAQNSHSVETPSSNLSSKYQSAPSCSCNAVQTPAKMSPKSHQIEFAEM